MNDYQLPDLANAFLIPLFTKIFSDAVLHNKDKGKNRHADLIILHKCFADHLAWLIFNLVL